MRWAKLGHVFVASGEHDWMLTHASNPTADHRGNGIFRIYFSARDKTNRSSVGWVEIDIRDPLRIIRIADRAALLPGTIGTFDDSGCSIGALVTDGRRKLMYYMGWNLGVTVPWRNSIGLAVSVDDGETFARSAPAPLIDRSAVDPYSLSYPAVLKAGGQWHMWYGSHLRWGTSTDDMIHLIKHATSPDGRSWARDGRVVIEPSSLAEYAFSRPSVVHRDLYQMWYTYRGAAYRIGYAQSPDGQTWQRLDQHAGIEPTAGEWDGDSLSYPYVFDHGANRYMLYCGNGYGRTGFGIAILDTD
jgi:hypothetical protein